MKKIYIAGHTGMVGSAILRKLSDTDNDIIISKREDLDLTNQDQVEKFFKNHNFDYVYLAAAKVGGIYANNEYPADFIYQNLMIQNNIIFNAFKNNVKKLLFLGSSCIYPKLSPQPISEESLLSGYLEPTNEPYAIAKIAGIKLCESFNRQFSCDFRSIMPTNLYGQNDNFHNKDSHVLPSLIKKFHEAKINNLDTVTLWGSGSPYREFLHVDDMADAAIFVMSLDKDKYTESVTSMNSHINIGSGTDCTINELAQLISSITQYKGEIVWDKSMPDGTPRKLMDVSKINKLGWKPKISLKEGIEKTYDWFLNHQSTVRD